MNSSQRRPSSLTAVILFLLSHSIHKATATFSIVATDNQSRQVGGAGASCNPSGDIFSGLYVGAPNHGVLHTQALLLESTNPIVTKARQMMQSDENVNDILEKMNELDSGDYTLNVGSFPSSELRQYGIADFTSNGGYTGKSLKTAYTLAGMAEGTEQVDQGSTTLVNDRYSYHAMGNVVAEGTVQALESGFLKQVQDTNTGSICAMAEALMSAMEQVLTNGLGDMRCINDHNGISATGAYLHIDSPDGYTFIHISKNGDGSYEPIEELKLEFDNWKEMHCKNNDVEQRRDRQRNLRER